MDEEIEFKFPECQYIANGLDPKTAQKLGDTYRVGNFIEPIGNEIVDRISNRLNQIQHDKADQVKNKC
ncbi:MAG: hypothetical protein P2A85_29290 (plasmid) [Microcoleus anatoxicus]|uniref:hypothetical protein n=1 Tax=Microcoleus anatoxicus TaxID=2705319 RepID=UPI00367283D8